MSNWKDFLKTPKMSKPTESKATMTRRKPKLSWEEECEPSPDSHASPAVSDEEDEKKTTPQRPRGSTKQPLRAPSSEDEVEDETLPPTVVEAPFRVVSYKKPLRRPAKGEQPQPELELANKFCDESLYTKKGIIFNILNNQCHGTSQFVKALRTNVENPASLGQYLETNMASLKATAALLVHEYFLSSRVNIGLSPDLTVDDYAPSFTMASLSEEGRSILPNGEQEGPIWYSLFPNLIKKTKFRFRPDGSIDEAYVVNFRLHQVNPNIRIRPPGNARPQPGKATRKGNQYVTLIDPAARKTGNFLGPRTGATILPPPLTINRTVGKGRSKDVDEALSMAQEAQEISRDALQLSQEARRELASLKSDKIYPDLPETPAPKWSHTGAAIALPDDY